MAALGSSHCVHAAPQLWFCSAKPVLQPCCIVNPTRNTSGASPGINANVL